MAHDDTVCVHLQASQQPQLNTWLCCRQAQKAVANMSRTGSDRRVGPAAAEKLVRILCSADPSARIAEMPG